MNNNDCASCMCVVEPNTHSHGVVGMQDVSSYGEHDNYNNSHIISP